MSNLQDDWERVALRRPPVKDPNAAVADFDYNKNTQKYRVTVHKGGRNLSKQFNADRPYTVLMGMSMNDFIKAESMAVDLERKLDLVLP